MIRRPTATDTEDDLLAFQEKFMSSGEKPSASVDPHRKIKVGSKRDQHDDSSKEGPAQARDVVDIKKVEGGIAKPPAKRSKFKEERMKKKKRSAAPDQHELMEDQDTHVTKILSEIQERDTINFTMSMPRYTTRGGFPSAHTLDTTTMVTSATEGQAKKSLFAQAFEAHGSSFFGLEEMVGQDEQMVEGGGGVSSGGSKGGEEVAADTIERLDFSSLISGEGLMSVGASKEAAKEEVMKIHEENVQRLSSLSEEERKKERENIVQQLDPNLLSFLKSRHLQKQPLQPSTGDHMTMDHTPKPPVLADTASDMTTPTSWVHMDVVERDKMEWMTDVPSHGTAPLVRSSNEIRFSLEGLVIPRSIVIPAHLGLHHHGDEPQAAGYTLNELLSLCRSTVLQQRTFSLQLLAKVIQRARHNEYSSVKSGSRDKCEDGDSVLEQLLASDVPLLLRYSLDENVSSVMFAAAAGLHSLLVTPPENVVLEEFMLSYFGCVLPALRSHDKQTAEEGENETEILHQDIILGYLNMKLLHRLRYIMEVCAPPTPLPSHLLDVVTMVARHSVYAATEVYSCPRLMDVVFSQFLPLDWSTERGGVVDGPACASALKLVCALVSASRNITTALLSCHHLSSVLVRYTIPPPSELGLPQDHSLPLSTTALLTWALALGYGLASHAVRDTFPELLKQLHCVSLDNGSSPLQANRNKALLCLVEAVLRLMAITPEQLKIEGTSDTHPPPAVDWSHARALLAPLLSLTQQLTETTEDTPCAGNVLHCLSTYYHLSPPNVSPVDLSEQLASLFKGPFLCLASSPLFTNSLLTIRDTSGIATSHDTPGTPPPPSLPSHFTLPTPNKPALYGRPTMQSGDYHSLVQPRLSLLTATNLTWGYIRLVRVALHSNKATATKVAAIVCNPVYIEYLKKVAQSEGSKASSTIDLVELYMLYESVLMLQSLMELGSSVPEGCGQLTFDLGHRLLKLLPPGLESIVWDLVSTVVLHPLLIRTRNQSPFLEQDVISLSLRDQPQPITVQDRSTITNTTSQLLTDSLAHLPTIRTTYQLALRESGVCSRAKILRSEAIFNGHPFQTPSKLLPPCHAPIMPEDWILLPIMLEYSKTTTETQKKVDRTDSSERVVSMVTCSLQLLLLLEHLHPHLLRKLPTSAKIARLMCIFLIDSELFLERMVHDLLASLLNLYYRGGSQLDFTTPIPGLTSFVDLYTTLLEQFSAVSYGDHLFSCFLLLPLQQLFSSHLRKLVWGENPTIIRVFSLPLTEVPVPLDNFLVPIETDMQLIDMYMSALSAETVRRVWSPLFYLVAVHHVHSCIFSGGSLEGQRRQLLQRVVNLSNQETKRCVLLYVGVDTSSPAGVKLREQLDERQLTIIKSLLGTTINLL